MKGRKRINTEQKWIKGETQELVKKIKNPGSAHVGFVVDEVALGQVSRFPLVKFIPPLLHYS
jgi:hypothetical protein